MKRVDDLPEEARTTKDSSRLAELARISLPVIRRAVAENSYTTRRVLDSLAKDPCEEVRRAVAKNPSTSLKTLKFLAYDEDKEVQETATYILEHLPEKER